MKKKNLKRIAAAALAFMMVTQSASNLTAVQAEEVQVRSQSETQMSSDKEVVYVNTYDDSKREQNFDANWKFYLGDATGAESKTFDDSTWENVNLPHDYSIEQEYTQSGEAESAYLLGGTGWYRKHFTLTPDMAGKEIRIDFGGVYMNSTVWVNGTQLGTHPYGYTPFSFDITDYVTFDQENVITVKVDHQTPSSRWYSGSGIYRSVNLTVMDKVHVDLYGTQITTPNLATEAGKEVTMNIATTVANEDATAKDVVLVHTLYEKGSTDAVATVTTDATSVEAGDTAKIDAVLKVNDPKLWGIGKENAHLYTVTTEVKVGDNVVDAYDTEYGFRYTSYDTETGFYLNGQPVKLKGVCMHHDQGSLGAEAHYRAIERQVEILQEMGCNSIRVTHNPAADELIEICNEKGVLVIDELFDGWIYPKNGNSNDYAKWFRTEIEDGNQIIGAEDGMTWAKFDLRATINRGKNAPSIIMWSLGNEIQEGTGIYSGYQTVADDLISWAQEIYDMEGDDARLLTVGSNAVKGGDQEQIGVANKITAVGGTSGTNYSGGSSYDSLHSNYPDWYLYGSETASHVNSRGVYTTTASNTLDANQALTSYDYSAVGWGATASSAWYDVITRDFVFGEYVWTGFDYLGEPTPANGTGSGMSPYANAWPAPKNSFFGIIDTAGLPKDNYYFYQSQWNDEVTTLHVLPAWNEDVVVSGSVPIVVYSDAAAVELFFIDAEGNRESLGKKEFTKHTTDAGYTYQMYEGTGAYTGGNIHRNMYLTWNKAFEAGTIEAVAYDENNNVITDTVGRSSVTTTGEATQLSAVVDRTEIAADGKDLAYITVDVKDADGNIVPDAANNVKFTVEGNGVLVGVDNGNQTDHQSYQDDNRKAYNGSLIAIVQSTKEAGSFTVTATSAGLEADSVTVTTVAADTDASAEAVVDSFYMSKNYYVKTGNTVVLPTTIETRYTKGEPQDLPVVWDEITETEGTFGVSGLVDGKYSVSVVVNMIDEVATLLNYSTTTSIGREPVLPDTRPAVLVDGEILNISFSVAWEDMEQADYAKAGTFVVNGTANVLGKVIDVTATVRVQEEAITIAGKVDNPHSLTQDIEEDKQSDTLEAVWDGSTVVGANSDGGPNETAWTNYDNSQADDNTAEIIFEYATEQRVGGIVVHFFEDSWSARYPDAGVTEIYVSGTGVEGSWQKVEATETIGEAKDSVKAYEYSFTPVPATFVKFCLTNKDQVLDGRKPCTGIVEIEIMKAVGSFNTYETAELAEVTVNGTELTEAEIAKGVYYTLEETATVDVTTADNAAVTVLPAYEKEILVIVESEDHKTRETFTIKLEQEAPIDPADSSKDYPVDKLTATAGSEQTGQTSEGPASFALDGNTSTHYHSAWNPKATDDQLWVQLELEEATALTALRYLPRSGPNNGTVTEYQISYSMNGTEWTTIATGEWLLDKDWKLAQFDSVVEAKYVKLFAVDSVADGAGRHMSAAEIRLVTAGETTTPDPDPGLELTPGEAYPVDAITVTAGSTYGSSIGYATDNNTTTYWETNWGQGVNNTGKLWFQLELEEATDVDQVLYYPRYQGTDLQNGDQNGFISKYRVEVSMTGEEGSWETVAEGEWSPADAWLTAEFNDVEAKYVRLVGVETLSNGIAKNADMSIAEIRVRVADGEVVTPDPVNKAALEEAIEAAEALTEADYTPNSWAVLESALTAAEELYASETATQSDVDAKAAALNAAIGALVRKANKAELAAVIAEAKELKEADYTASSWTVFANALADAETANNDANASQNAVDIAKTTLEAAMAALVVKADKTALAEAIADAEALKATDYTADSWNALEAALEQAATVNAKEDATQEEVNVAVSALEAAMAALVNAEKPVDPGQEADKSALGKYYDECVEYYEEEKHSEETWAAYQDALEAVEAVLADKDATEEDVQEALAALIAATEALNEELEAEDDDNVDDENNKDDEEDNVQTGDTTSVMWTLSIMLIAAMSVVVLLKKRMNR